MTMPLTQRILVPYSEYQRLQASETRLTTLLEEERKKGHRANLGAVELVGGGATAGPLAGLVGNFPDNQPTSVDTNAVPPRASPFIYDGEVPSNEDRIRQEVKNNDRVPSLPLNTPLLAKDPTDMQASTSQPKKGQAVKSLGHGVTEHPWYYQGPDDFSSDDEDEEDHLHRLK